MNGETSASVANIVEFLLLLFFNGRKGDCHLTRTADAGLDFALLAHSLIHETMQLIFGDAGHVCIFVIHIPVSA